MTRSVEELRRESERNRAELAATVERLKQGISDTTRDLRHMVSPQHVKSEVSDYVSDKAQGWVEGLKQQAMDNPMRAVAAGTAIAVPLLRMAKGVPLPLLMIAAGLALTSKTVRDRAAGAVSPVMDGAGRVIDQTADRVQEARSGAQAKLSESQGRAAGAVNEAINSAKTTAQDLKARATEVAGTIGDQITGGMDAIKDSAASAPEQARQIIGDNAALIGGLGIAIGAIIAAALPQTKLEDRAAGPASDSLKRAAGEAAQSGFEAAKEATLSAADAATRSVSEADLGRHASRMTRNLADNLKEAATEVVDAAFSPSPKSST
ncbi:F0F1-type ATP synthase membrane subunit b/b' [Bradyrhizobium diazoefficiens]